MKVRETLKALLKTAADNDLQHVLRLRPLLEDGIRRFGDREVADVLTTELEPLARQHADILRLDQNVEAEKRSWDEKWQQYYHQRFVLKQPARLPWQWNPGEPTPALRQLFDRLDLRPERALDLGCGDGMDSIFLAGRSGSVTAVDVSTAAIEIARSAARARDVDNCEFLVSDIFDLQPDMGSFEFLLDKGCLHHVPFFRYADYIALVSGLVAPGGLYFLICHSLDIGRNAHPLRFQEGLVQPYLGAFSRVLRFAQYGQTESMFSEREIRGLFAGVFEILEISRPDRGDGNPDPLACLMRRR